MQTLITNASVTYANPTNPLWIGKRGPATQPWSGVLDELRISTAVRSTPWIATEYNNQSAPAAFFTLWAQQTRPLPSITVTSSPTGRLLTVDNVGCTSPCTFQWIQGSIHTIAAASQAGSVGVHYLS